MVFENRRYRHILVAAGISLLCFCSLFYFYQRNIADGGYLLHSAFTMKPIYDKNKPFKIVWFRRPRWILPDFNFSQCKYHNCELSSRKDEMNHATAVIFHYRFLSKKVPKKNKGQKWVLWTLESPANDKALASDWNEKFDWSASYRTDSDIHVSWKLKLREKPIYKNYTKIFQQKSRQIAWVVSNCKTPSKRHKFVKELEKYMKVDKFGHCGGNKEFCKNKTSIQCHNSLSEKYWFYLGLENSICKDYVTEKVFHNFMDENNMVYIVRGAPNINERIPKNTFINTNNFKSPRDLAEFLNRLKSDEENYVSFLREKDKYVLLSNKTERAYCSLCELLNQGETKPPPNGRNFNMWFRQDACYSPKDNKQN